MPHAADAGHGAFLGEDGLGGLVRKAQAGLQRQHAGHGFFQALLGENATLEAVHYVAIILGQILVEQEHVCTRRNGGWHGVGALHGAGVAHHGRSVGDDQAVEAQLAAEQTVHQLGRKRGRHRALGQGGIQFAPPCGLVDVTDHESLCAVLDHAAIDLAITTINSILRNEKYKGDALLQKSFTVDFLTKTMKPNRGELPSYYVKESHPPIISADEFDMVQAEIERRSRQGRGYSGNSIFSSKLFCGDCGGLYGAKVWHSNDAYRRVIWQCNRKFSKTQEQCKTPHLTEDTIKEMFLKAYNRLMRQRKQLIEDCELMKSLLTDCAEQEAGMEQLRQEIEEIADMTQNLVRQNTRQIQSQEAYNAKYNALVERYEKASAKHDKLEAEIARRNNKARQLASFIDHLEKAPASLEEWDSQVWSLLLEKGTVNRDGSVAFEFRNGKEIKVEAK